MSTPRIEIDLSKIAANAASLVALTAEKGVRVTAVTKAFGGRPDIARALVGAGVAALGDSRIDNIERLRTDCVQATTVLIRSPMPSQTRRVVRAVEISLNSEIETIELLSKSSVELDVVHGVVLMVELGDLREGFMPDEVDAALKRVLDLPRLHFAGIGANLACRSGVIPDAANMGELSEIADRLEAEHSVAVDVVSGGNSANLDWLMSGTPIGRINDLRLGESILLGREPLHRKPLAGLHADSFVLIGEVIESRRKPTEPWGQSAQSAFPRSTAPTRDSGAWQTIVALGRQDTDPDGLAMPEGITYRGASSDHLVLGTEERFRPGAELRFIPDYSALVRSMTCPNVRQVRCS